MWRRRTTACRAAPVEGDARTASAQDTTLPGSSSPAPTTADDAAVPSAARMTGKHGASSDICLVPEHIVKVCKSVTSAQLVAKLRSQGTNGDDLATAINEAASQMSLPGFPRNDIGAILSLLVPFLKSSQPANKTVLIKEGSSEALSIRKNAKPEGAKKPAIIASEMHAPSTVDCRLGHDSLAAQVPNTLSGNAAVITPMRSLVVELDRLTSEDIASFTSRRYSSHVLNERSQGIKRCRKVAKEPVPVHSARTSGAEDSSKEPSVHVGSSQGSGNSNSNALAEPAVQKQPFQNDSQRRDCDASESPSQGSPSLLESRRHQNVPSPQHSPQAPDAEDSLQRELQVPEARSMGVQDLLQPTKRHIIRSISPEVSHPLSKRKRFTTLQEEALVYGVMKYGRGSWKEISEDGWFDGRRPVDLSDKYRNLEKYDHLPKVKRRVREMLQAGRNPLKELRALYKRQHLQRATSPLTEQLPQGKQVSVSQPKQLQGASSVLGSSSGSSTAMSSDDEAPAEPSLECEAGTALKTPCDGLGGTSMSQAHPSARGQRSSRLNRNASQESVVTKAAGKQQRVPFTPLEVEALVAGVLKYGKGNWYRILREGGFLGRTSTNLSDKYRNLKQYRHLEAVEKTVKAKFERGEDPLTELRVLSAAHWKR